MIAVFQVIPGLLVIVEYLVFQVQAVFQVILVQAVFQVILVRVFQAILVNQALVVGLV